MSEGYVAALELWLAEEEGEVVFALLLLALLRAGSRG